MNKDLKVLHHRSKERIKGLGEVFTPDLHVEKMMNLLGKKDAKVWSDLNISFFEPTCGHGNFVTQLFKQRVLALFKSELRDGTKAAALSAIANSINTLWAIDIDLQNVNECRSRILKFSLAFLCEKLKLSPTNLINEDVDFYAHLLCAIRWHIDENEALSALSNGDEAFQNASKTKFGRNWIQGNGHNHLDFDLSWTAYYKQCEIEGLTSLLYEDATKLLTSLTSGQRRQNSNFDFALKVLQDQNVSNYISNLVDIGA